ncbi:hypothetical protein [Caenimonas aquaedulcis]|uniref:Uncharacterized protein n=1 Tax=Caenimonas aquaedulcis TaxID=2793270 RepID=A0A931H946_9BURK|nr:hypothetical protein [Caenimonas aquaedulcis]MBG9390667.1 hypothetical protein [Caenimonas aquaedulcis]
MGLLLALSVFVYPLALPVVTVAGLYLAAFKGNRDLPSIAMRGLVVLPPLVLLFTPGIYRGGAGAFLLPWWLFMFIGHEGVSYYAVTYIFICGLGLAMLGMFAVWFDER